MRTQNQHVTIPLSGTVSGTFAIPNADRSSLYSPVVTSCQMFLQGSWDTTSANFARVQNVAGSGDWTYGVGGGSKQISFGTAGAFPYVRIETDIAQSAVRSLTIMTRF